MTQEQFIKQVINTIKNNIRLLRMGIESTDNLEVARKLLAIEKHYKLVLDKYKAKLEGYVGLPQAS